MQDGWRGHGLVAVTFTRRSYAFISAAYTLCARRARASLILAGTRAICRSSGCQLPRTPCHARSLTAAEVDVDGRGKKASCFVRELSDEATSVASTDEPVPESCSEGFRRRWFLSAIAMPRRLDGAPAAVGRPVDLKRRACASLSAPLWRKRGPSSRTTGHAPRPL